MADKDKYVSIADLKAKLRYWCKSRGASKQTMGSLIEIINRIPYTVRADISETLDSTGWIPCSERLPENDAKCLVYTSDKRVCMARWYGKYDEQGAWYIISDDVPKLYRIKNVPFWMPLPEPPKEV